MEKLTLVENLSNLRGHNRALQDQLSSFKASLDDAIKQKESLMNELRCLRGELQQVREDHDSQIAKVQALVAEVEKHKEYTGKPCAKLDTLTIKSNALEETCSSQRERIHMLEHQLAAANEKLKELKGNIRVFCRVWPLLPDDNAGTETTVISYPTSTEALGQKYPFTFDKVFNHEASQQDVFVEISQLVQSALDGYERGKMVENFRVSGLIAYKLRDERDALLLQKAYDGRNIMDEYKSLKEFFGYEKAGARDASRGTTKGATRGSTTGTTSGSYSVIGPSLLLSLLLLPLPLSLLHLSLPFSIVAPLLATSTNS
ncbi:hypothetical protein FEM48_Zijuj10G0091100 [Ziziphus jujuba var. spinosa]|uniref:Kinesin motor domain-containing protein n=1 Tax=Ziziphus jujuba var. spinosa TaxID=714518 RepID=A0A978UMH6_ZIZJJ|nr:hypothetical protein FEM48_Zijuj10G0091100 [Ziziphus jujuba var. spinosa]